MVNGEREEEGKLSHHLMPRSGLGPLVPGGLEVCDKGVSREGPDNPRGMEKKMKKKEKGIGRDGIKTRRS